MAVTHPRRRPSDSVPSLQTSKAATFHQARSPASASDPVLHIPSLPHRAPTCIKEELEALVENKESRVQEFLDSIEESLRGLRVTAQEESKEQSNIDGVSTPKPRGSFTPPGSSYKHHASDSGIGSSESSESEHEKPDILKGSSQATTKIAMASEQTKDSASQRVLSEYACRQIQKHIINPILQQEQLKPFHPLVKYLPFRIAEKKITTLRDLERVIFWLAPKYSVTAKAFLEFSQTTIQCIHATYPHLDQSEQVKPGQQPYTNRYFLDLTEQVRQFAQMVSRQRDASTGKQVRLQGGLGRTGRSAELTYVRDGKTFSLRTGEEVDETSVSVLKRTVDDNLDDDLTRSMARRKKNAPPEKNVQRCSECSKEFNRPCDLTKHEKTHSRPWKCPDSGCKYHDYGWPTEKERDRHVNDKHAENPQMYKCLFPPCPYESKRESNCKQHMEKAHGWNYSRTKSNGKGLKRNSIGQAPPTPQMSTPGSHIFAAPSPGLSALSPANTIGTDIPSLDFAQPIEYGALQQQQQQSHQPNSSSFAVPMQPQVPQFDFERTFGPLNDDFRVNEDDSLDLSSITFDPMANASPGSWNSAFGNDHDMKDEESIFGNNFDWANQDLTSLNVHLLSPATASDLSMPTPAQSKAMLPTPQSICIGSPAEDDYDDFAQTSKDTGMVDFALFGGKQEIYGTNSTPLFDDIGGEHTYGGHIRL